MNKNNQENIVPVRFKGFWGRLFCRHNARNIPDLVVYEKDGDQHPCEKYVRFICTKCGKIYQYKFF